MLYIPLPGASKALDYALCHSPQLLSAFLNLTQSRDLSSLASLQKAFSNTVPLDPASPGSLISCQHLRHGGLVSKSTNTSDRTLPRWRDRGAPDTHQLSSMCSHHSETPAFHVSSMWGAGCPPDFPVWEAPKYSDLSIGHLHHTISPFTMRITRSASKININTY